MDWRCLWPFCLWPCSRPVHVQSKLSKLWLSQRSLLNHYCLCMKYSPTYKVVWMVGPRKGQNFFSKPLLRSALWSCMTSRSYGEVVSQSEAWREAGTAARAAGVFASLWLPSPIATSSQRTLARLDRPSQRWESQPRSVVLIKTILQQKCQPYFAA